MKKILIGFFLVMFFLLSIQVNALGLNVRTDSVTVESGENFCVDYYLFNTFPEDAGGFLSVAEAQDIPSKSEQLIKLTPYYNEIEKIKSLQKEIEELKDEKNRLEKEMKKNPENIEELKKDYGIADKQIREKGNQISSLNNEIKKKIRQETVEVPGLNPKLKEKYDTPKKIREFLMEDGRVKKIQLCLRAPNLEKEIEGECYTKTYYGMVVLSPIEKINKNIVVGSQVQMEIGSELTVTVVCKSGLGGLFSKINYLYLIAGGGVAAIILVILVIVKLIKNKKKPQKKEKNEEISI